MATLPSVYCVHQVGNSVGESPLWIPEEQALYWVDAYAGEVLRHDDSGKLSRWPLGAKVGSIVRSQSGGFVAGMAGGFKSLELGQAGTLPRMQVLADPALNRPDTVLNDGKCDRRGRYWCGSRDLSLSSPIGALYRLDAALDCREVESGFIVSNGIAFSPDDRTMYFADSRRQTVWAYDFDVVDGTLRNRRIFVETGPIGGRPDGATVDTDGCYWCALVHGGALARFTPEGRLDRRIELPVRHPTMCSFGGPGLNLLYVTSAAAMLTEAEHPSQPLAGALFAVDGLGAQGLAEPAFQG